MATMDIDIETTSAEETKDEHTNIDDADVTGILLN